MAELKATPYANPLTGLSNDAIQGLLGYMRNPNRTQQLQGLGRLIESTGIPKTIERAAYAESPTGLLNAITNVNRANVPLLKPETADALMTLSPVPSAANKAGMAVGRAGERSAERVVPQIMDRGGAPAGILQDLAQGTQRQIFVGPKSKTWDAASNAVARNMEEKGATPREIWSATGNWRTPENKWSQEIPDNTAEFRTNFEQSIASKANNYMGGLEGPIGGMYRNQDLYSAYPQLLTTDRMKVTKLPEWLPESANTASYSRTFGGKGITDIRNQTEPGALKSVTHELQHGVQNLEGWQSGGMESQFKDLPNMTAFEQYRMLQGEAMARAAAERRMLTPEQRRAIFPEDSYDVPLSSLRSR
jgi:hypothetical protein